MVLNLLREREREREREKRKMVLIYLERERERSNELIGGVGLNLHGIIRIID